MDHVRPVLSSTHNPINLRGGRIVSGNSFRPLGSEPQFAANKVQAMRAIQSSGVDIGQRFLCHEVNDRKRMVSSPTVNGYIGRFPIQRTL